MKVFIFLVCSVFAVKAASISDRDLEEWQLYKVKYNKIYASDDEEIHRRNIFMDNKRMIEGHNARYEKGEVSFKMGINKFADLLFSEFSEKYKGYKGGSKAHTTASTFVPPADYQEPDEVNWVEKGAVTPVKDQGQCGSCWAFSATGGLEGQEFLKKGKLISLSEQNLVDCSKNGGNAGCSGGLMTLAFEYVKDNGGIDTERSYPYEAREDKCRYKPENSGATDTGYVKIPTNNETALKLAVATVGPISVAIDATDEFQFYDGGILNDSTCNNTESSLDHGVLAAGYGTDEKTGEKYWLVKNSWGEHWGEKGYLRMARDNNNMCGIATDASYPLV